MEPRYLLLAFVVLTHALTSFVWWTAGTWMGLSRRAATYWLLTNAMMGTALTISLLNEIGPLALRALTAWTLAALGAGWMRQGLQTFLKLPRHETREMGIGIGLLGLTLLVCLPTGQLRLGIGLSLLLIVWTLLACIREIYAPLRKEFDRNTACTVMAMLGLVLGLVLLVGTAAVWPQGPWSWLGNPTEKQFLLAFLSVILSILTSFVLGYVVVIRLVQRLRHLSLHDALTDLLNRRAIEQLLQREAQRLQRFQEAFSVILIDIDHFKHINDRHGHAVGDHVLTEVAARLRSQAREVDRVARFGGEEFCVLLPHTDPAGALQAAERLRLAVCQTPIPLPQEAVTVTASLGLACADNPQESLQSLLRRADQALYQAKDGGRNQVVVAAAPALA